MANTANKNGDTSHHEDSEQKKTEINDNADIVTATENISTPKETGKKESKKSTN